MAHRIVVVAPPEHSTTDLRTEMWREGWDVTQAEPGGLEGVLRSQLPDAAVLSSPAPLDTGLLDRVGVPFVVETNGSTQVIASLRALFPVPNPLQLLDVSVDLERRTLTRDAETHRLTPTEVQLLRFLVANADRVTTEAELGRKVWGHHDRVRSRAAVSAIYRLRKKLEAEPARPRILRSLGGGYRLMVTRPAEPAPSMHDNLPATRDAFEGRVQELARLARFAEQGRIVTLTGPGGAGKSRIAVEFARRQGARFDAGCWFVDLTETTSDDAVVHEIAVALAIAGKPGDARETIANALRDRGRLLLVLDNCERVVRQVAPIVSEWLDSCPDLVILATSRERLGIRGEQVLGVAPLAVPERDDLEVVADNEAARLFVLRARQQDPDFTLTEDNASLVARIARTVDGLPLALELVATMVGTVALADLARGLDESLDVATGLVRDRHPRHLGLRAALDWSWDQLDPEERETLAQLTIFAGGWRLEAAEAVVQGARPSGMLTVLQRLAEKSMVQRVSDSRYGLLVSVRRHAREQLEAAQAEALSERHARFFVDQEPRPEELHNLQAAARYALGERDAELAGALARKVWAILQRSGHQQPAAELGRGVLAIEKAPDRRAQLNVLVGMAEDRQGHVEVARRHLFDAMAEAEASGDAAIMARCAGSLGIWHWRNREFDKALDYYERAARMASELGDQAVYATARLNQGITYLGMRRFDQAHRHFVEGAERYTALGSREGMAQASSHLGFLSVLRGEYTEGRHWLEQAVAQARTLGNRWLEAESLGHLGRLALELGDLDEAIRKLREGLRTNAELGNRRGEMALEAELGEVHLVRKQLDPALASFNAALAIARAVDDKTYEGDMLGRLALCHERSGRGNIADLLLSAGRRALVSDGAERQLARLLAVWAKIRSDRDDIEGARGLWAEAEAVARHCALEPTMRLGREIEAIRTSLPTAVRKPISAKGREDRPANTGR